MSLFMRRPLLFMLVAIGTAILIALGTWQVQRLAWKTKLIAKVEERVGQEPIDLADALTALGRGEDIEYLPVRLTGGFESSKIAHVFGTYEGAPGYYAFQAMRLDDGSGLRVLINRGFVPQDLRQDEYQLPSADAITGLVRTYTPPGGIAGAVAPESQAGDGVFFTRDQQVLASFLTPGEEGSYLPITIDSTLPTELPQGGTTRVAFRNAHLGYAITWYGLAVTLVVVAVVFVRTTKASA